MDIIGRWIDERCVKGPFEAKTADLYTDYEDWTRKEIGFSMSRIAFGRELVDRGFESKKVGGQRGVRGLKIGPI